MDPNKVLIARVEEMQNMLLSIATGGHVEVNDYKMIREFLVGRGEVADKLPRFLLSCREPSHFWAMIKPKFPTYKERRLFIYEGFEPAFLHLEQKASPSVGEIQAILEKFNAESVHEAWLKALDRKQKDPAGAITSARTLLESICKHILDEESIKYPCDSDLPKLYKLCSEALNLAPSQHTEGIFKQILGGCASVVEGLGALRNKVGDAHGNGKIATKPSSRHAHLAVNLAGSMATYLIETWEAKKV